MRHFKAGYLCTYSNNFGILHAEFATTLPDETEDLKGLVKKFRETVHDARQICEDLRLSDALATLKRILQDLPEDASNPTVLSTHARNALRSVIDDLDKRRFLYIKANLEAYLDRRALFGARVGKAFPSAARDIREAGNCLAVECNTAAVFHLMRVAEHGLRVLARKVKVSVRHKGKRQPIELSDWNKLIDGIRVRITTIRKRQHGSRRAQMLQFYSDMADHCEYMKDIWRNEAAHARKPYNATDALGVMQRVEGFMKSLAGGL